MDGKTKGLPIGMQCMHSLLSLVLISMPVDVMTSLHALEVANTVGCRQSHMLVNVSSLFLTPFID